MKILFVSVVVFAAIIILNEMYFRRKFNIHRLRSPLPESGQRALKKWFLPLLVFYLIWAVIGIFLFENLDVLIIILPYLIANMLVRGGIERKYNKKARVWILEYSQAAWATILFLVLLIFF